MHRRRFMSAGIGALALASGGVPAGAFERTQSPRGGLSLYRGGDLAFGTTVTIQVLHDSEHEARLAMREAFDRIGAAEDSVRAGSQDRSLDEHLSRRQPGAYTE